MTEVDQSKPFTVRMVLGARLRELREASGVKYDRIKTMRLGSQSTISRIENGQVPVDPHRVVGLCRLYGAPNAVTDELESLAFRAPEDTMLDQYSDVVPRWFSVFVQLEAMADRIRGWYPLLPPGLLQTPATARAIFSAYRPALDQITLERSLEIRAERQRLALAEKPGRLTAIIDESVLVRTIGGPQVAAEQLGYMRHVHESGHAHVRILTFASGAHPVMEGPMTLLEFDPGSSLSDVVYCESVAGATYVDRPARLPGYREKYEALTEQSIPLEEYAP